MHDPSYPVICAFGAVLCLIPLPWHWQARNASTLIYLGWASTACIVYCINSILWDGNVDNKAPVWCDISSRYIVCLNSGITSAGLCIQRRLYRVATIREVHMTEQSKKRELVINLILGLGLPVLTLPLYYTVQSARYAIMEGIGCWPATYPTWMTHIMFSMWPVLASIGSFVYAALTLRAFFQTRRQFSKVLSESGADLSLSRFFRLMALAATDMAFALPLSLYFMISDPVDREYYPYSWADVHENIHDIIVQTEKEMLYSRGYKIGMEFSHWSVPGCAFMFFMYFGLSGEAMRQYKRVFWRVVALFGFKPPSPKPKIQTVNWTHRRTACTTTSLELIVPSPIHTTQSKTEQMGNMDDRVETSVRGSTSATDLKDVECQSSHVEGYGEWDAQTHTAEGR